MSNINTSRPIKIHVCKDRTLSFRAQHMPIFNGVALPVFSVNSFSEAEELVALVGQRQYIEHPQMPGLPWYKMTYDERALLEFEDLEPIAAKLAERYEQILAVRRQRLEAL